MCCGPFDPDKCLAAGQHLVGISLPKHAVRPGSFEFQGGGRTYVWKVGAGIGAVPDPAMILKSPIPPQSPAVRCRLGKRKAPRCIVGTWRSPSYRIYRHFLRL